MLLQFLPACLQPCHLSSSYGSCHRKPFSVKHAAVLIDENTSKSHLSFTATVIPDLMSWRRIPVQPQTSQVSMFTSSPVQNVKRNRYHCTSARTVSARRLSAILALEIVVQEDYFDRRIEGASKRRGKRARGIQKTYS